MMNSTVGIAASLLSDAKQTEVSLVHLFLLKLFKNDLTLTVLFGPH